MFMKQRKRMHVPRPLSTCIPVPKINVTCITDYVYVFVGCCLATKVFYRQIVSYQRGMVNCSGGIGQDVCTSTKECN